MPTNQESVVPTKISRVHDLRDMPDEMLYDETQTNSAIEHGDVLLCKDGIAIMLLAWPTIIFGSCWSFHDLVSDTSWDEILTEREVNQLHMGEGALQRLEQGLLTAWALACG